MRACRIDIKNFRGVSKATILLPKHGVLIGDNNTGKTTILEALDLVLGPDRLNKNPPIDEHDFFRGKYRTEPTDINDKTVNSDKTSNTQEEIKDKSTEIPHIEIEVSITDLTEDQKAKFGDYIEFWDSTTNTFYVKPDPAEIDLVHISEALRITFHGQYNEEEDDFEGRTFFTRSLTENETPQPFTKKDKQVCGFLYLRSIRTGSRALSLERGSLLDIILRLKEIRPQMWEDTLQVLSQTDVASNPDLGISPVLESINKSLKKYVPSEWGIEPHLRVSSLTREHLRKIITAFITTDDGNHSAPFYRQGSGTINMLMLAMLSQIAEKKQNVIFAMEEPETAIPPYAQKRIVHEVRKLATQTLFTSHSPYVLEEFDIEETIILGRNSDGLLIQKRVSLPSNVKLKRYRQEFRTRFCEGLLARRVLIAEGPTEASAFPAVCRRLAELNPNTYASLEELGICTLDADGESNISGMAQLYRDLGKKTFALCDKQSDENKTLIESQVEAILMHQEKGFETLILKNTSEAALQRFAKLIDWPEHLLQKYPNPEQQASTAVSEYLHKYKGEGVCADFLAQCYEAEIPQWLRDACIQLKDTFTPTIIAKGVQAGSRVDENATD